MSRLRAAAQSVWLALLPALWMSVAVSVPSARAQGGPNLWSIQLHGGLFAPVEASGASPTVGVRYCKHYSPYLQAGMLSGYSFKRKSLVAPSDAVQGRETGVELARVDAHLVPVMVFMQVNLTKRFLVPFVGIGAGYEWLARDITDYRSGEGARAIYGNVAWEAWGGVGFRMTSRLRVNGELFYNGGSLERHVDDPGKAGWREAVHVNGVGARAGLDMIFE